MYSNPAYPLRASGILIPFSSWLFSSIAATILGNARALPFSVCTYLVLPSKSLNRNFNLFAWNVSKFDTELTSSHFFELLNKPPYHK